MKPLRIHGRPPVFISDAKIRLRLLEICNEINRDYGDKEIIAICILKGSFVFFSDLIRGITSPVTCEFLGVSSYGKETVSSGEVKVTLDLNVPIQNKHVLIVEDIVDTGLTLKYIQTSLRARGPASLKTCALLVKPDALQVPVDLDYRGFSIANEFVVGYGLDYAEKYRGLPYIGTLEPEH